MITATALSASVGDFDRFPSGRHFASSLGLMPREHSSGSTRRLGRVTRRGDVYLRMLLIHGARAVLRSAKVVAKKQQPLDRTQTWTLTLSERVGHNKAAVALANKQARRLRPPSNIEHPSIPITSPCTPRRHPFTDVPSRVAPSEARWQTSRSPGSTS